MYWFAKELGDYHCVVCDSKLFESNHKFMSKVGLPTFWGAIRNAVNVGEAGEEGHVPEVSCTGCSAHLGHLFPKGP
jgi:peptide-methionine (R)-S-oxide reductase